MKMAVPLLAALLVWPLTAHAAEDKDFYGVPGTPAYMSGDGRTEHPSIRLQSENIVVTLRPNELYETRGKYLFVNDSARAVTVKMGFPEFNNPARFPPLSSGFKQWSATIRGRKVEAPRVEVPARIDVISWRIATVKFAPRERVEVASMALSPVYHHGAQGGERLLSYEFAGRGWKGNVERTDVEVRVPQPGFWRAGFGRYNYKEEGEPWYAPAVEVKNGVGYLRRTWRDWSGEARGQWSLQRVMPGWLADPDDVQTSVYEHELPHLVTLQVGTGLGRVDAPAPQGYQQEGVTMVSLQYLAQAAAGSSLNSSLNWNAKTRAATLQLGGLKTSFVPGRAIMQVQRGAASEEVALKVAPRVINVAGQGMLYVPLEAAARALQLDFRVKTAEHSVVVKAPVVAAPKGV